MSHFIRSMRFKSQPDIKCRVLHSTSLFVKKQNPKSSLLKECCLIKLKLSKEAGSDGASSVSL